MRFTIDLQSHRLLTIPLEYNHLVQAAIYQTITPDLAAFLHDQGFTAGGRVFKLFTFSRLLGRFELDRVHKTLTFPEGCRLIIASPVNEFCQSIANGLLTKGVIRIGNSLAEIDTLEAEDIQIEPSMPNSHQAQIEVRTLSPIVVYSTLLRPDGRKYTCYFQPGDPDYNQLIDNNLRRKWTAFCGLEAAEGAVFVQRNGYVKQHIITYKDFIIKGYSGKFVLFGPVELLQMAMDCGIGGKSSQGMGCLQFIK